MNWKNFKRQIQSLGSDFKDENKFILGLDIGNSTSAISYWNTNLSEPQLIDISGGYGSVSMPTVVQYVPENKEWVFGEYALLNKGYFEDYTFENIVDKLGSKEIYDIDGKSVSVSNILGRFIKALVENCININPNAEISAIVVATQSYINNEAKQELKNALTIAGFENQFIRFVENRQCALRYYHYLENSIEDEKVVVIDYGGRDIRGGLYSISNKEDVELKALSSIISEDIATNKVNEKVVSLLSGYYCEKMNVRYEDIDKATRIQLDNFAYQNQNLIYQNQDKDLKLYYNFAFPAFQKNITKHELSEFINPFEESLKSFLHSICKNVVSNTISLSDIKKVIVLGGGFEMKWARKVVEEVFYNAEIINMKTTKGIISLGACITAAIDLGLLKNKEYNIVDLNIVNYDIGLKAISQGEGQFISLIEKGSFWWRQNTNKVFILNEATDKNLNLDIFVKDDKGLEKLVNSINLAGLPKRPKRTTKLEVSLRFKSFNTININVKDLGFGEIFEASDFEKNIEVRM